MHDSSNPLSTDQEGEAPDVSDLIVELLTRTEDDAVSQPAVLDELCRAWPSHASALRVAVGNLDAAGWIDIQPLPERVGDFKPIARLGGGGMGVVLLAEQPGLDRKVAIKLLRTDELLRDGARLRFQRETTAIARLAHPNIVSVHSVGLDNGIPFLVMDYIEGASLDRIIAAQRGGAPDKLTGDDVRTSIAAELAGMGVAVGSVDADSIDAGIFDGSWIEVALRVTRDVASALAHAHARGVLHRDVKPSNIMLTADGRVQLVDFGLATILDADRLTRSGSMVGSLPYMAPEELDTGCPSTPRGDVYALGVTLYELLILDLPFPGRGTARLRKDIEEGRLVRAGSLNPAIGADLEAVLATACCREVEGRYASASAFAADLTALLERRPVTARLPGAWGRLKNWAKRRPELAALAGVVGAVAIAAPILYGYLESVHADEVMEVNEQLKIALGDEEDARARADQHFIRAIDALERVTSHMAKDGLEDEPRMQRARLEIVDDALEILDELKEERPDHPYVLDTWAHFLLARGEVLMDLGQKDEGLEALENHLAVRQRIAVMLPGDLNLSCEVATAKLHLAWGLSHHARRPEGLVLYKEAISQFETALASDPGNVERTDLLGEANGALAAALLNLDRVDECREVVEAALPLAQSAALQRPQEALPHLYLGQLYSSLGGVLTQQGRHEDAERAYRSGADALRVALALTPGHRSYQSKIVLAEKSRAEALARLGRAEEALACLVPAFEGNDDLRRRYPSVVLYADRHISLLGIASYAEAEALNLVRAVDLGEQALRASLEKFDTEGRSMTTADGLNLAVSMVNLSSRVHMCTDLGYARFEQARAHALGALQLIEEHDPKLVRAREIARIAHYTLVLCAAMSDHLPAASEAMERLLPVTAERPMDLNHLADAWSEIYAAHVRAMSDKVSVDKAYEATITSLERAVNAGFSDYNALAEKTVFDPFRTDPRFVALVEQIAPTE